MALCLLALALNLLPSSATAPASSSPSPASAVTSAGTALPALLGVASENPRWSGNLVDYRPPAPERQRLPPNASGSCATKTPPRNTHRAGSWSSSADDTAVALDHPLHTRTRWPQGSTGPPRRTQNKPSGHPATIRAGSEVKANLVQEGKFGMFSSWFRIIRTPPHYFSSEFSRTKDEFSDTLLVLCATDRGKSRSGTEQIPILRSGSVLKMPFGKARSGGDPSLRILLLALR